MKPFHLLFFILAFFISNVQSQILFENAYDDTTGNYNTFHDVQQTVDGGYIVAGGLRNLSQTLLRLDQNGAPLWCNRYRSGLVSMGYTVKQTADSGFILASSGSKLSQPIDSGCIMILKTDVNGDTAWCKFFGFFIPTNFMPVCVEIMQNGDYLVGGTLSDPDTTYHILLMRMNPSGDTLWTKRYYGIGEITDLIIHNDTSIYFTTQNNGYNGSIIKTDTLGNILWDKYFTDLFIYSICTTGNSIIVNGVELFNPLPSVIISMDTGGTVLWSKKYNYRPFEYGKRIQPTNDSGFIAIGLDANLMIPRIVLMKLDAVGDTLWTRSFEYNDMFLKGYCIRQVRDSGYIFTANAYTGIGFFSQALLLKVDLHGNGLCNMNPSGFGISNYAPSTTIDTILIQSGVAINNRPFMIQSGTTFDQICGTTSIIDPEAAEFRIFPNPSNGKFLVSTTSLNNLIEIRSLEGRLISRQTISANHFELDLSGEPSGIYMVKLVSESTLLIRKVFKN